MGQRTDDLEAIMKAHFDSHFEDDGGGAYWIHKCKSCGFQEQSELGSHQKGCAVIEVLQAWNKKYDRHLKIKEGKPADKFGSIDIFT
jgi:hypothetical protein